jgi:5-methylcytosine-specific restriction endonuclease McrA
MFRGIGDPVDKFFALCDFEYPEAINTNITMKYEEFLQTPYWVVIREYVLFKWNNKCAFCGSSENLNVHHRTYEHRGREHTHISDLVVLCNSCHAKFHDKLAE